VAGALRPIPDRIGCETEHPTTQLTVKDDLKPRCNTSRASFTAVCAWSAGPPAEDRGAHRAARGKAMRAAGNARRSAQATTDCRNGAGRSCRCGIQWTLFYAPRRVCCPEHWSGGRAHALDEGKRPIARAMMGFLALWARRLSWAETARPSGELGSGVPVGGVVVAWGLAHRVLEGVEAIASTRSTGARACARRTF